MVSQQEFRQAMAALPAAVNVITTHGPSGCHGMTATAVCSVSDDPASLLICINRSARMHDVLVENGRFCVNVLAAGQDGVSGAFSARGLTIDERLAQAGDIVLLEGDMPALAEAQVALPCRVEQVIEAGTHTIFIGHVEQVVPGRGQGALAYYGRDYHHLTQREQAA
ncbi:flavin reductase [Novosphingobium rosa]|uniref:flavin reductase n=1 Tax=Novosphingobium rosa TaxID=76978 RepID=UPI000833B8FF|nr:flavin reductase [Novosphingobium rosa]